MSSSKITKTSAVVEVSHLAKSYRLYPRPVDRAKNWMTLGVFSNAYQKVALQDISFDLSAGECLGVIGRNGSGKSTLLSLVAGVLHPTSGKIHVHRVPFAMFEFSTGFHPNLTGAQNMFSVTRLLGLPEAILEKNWHAIVEYSELGEDMHRPIREYSAGMKARLMFSLFSHLEPDLFILDEAMSVGDESFRKKSAKRLREMIKDQHRTVILASHNMGAIRELCDRVLWLDGGIQKALGPVDDVVEQYLRLN